MPTFYHGKSAYFAMNDAGAVLRNLSDALRDVTLNRTADTAETSAFGTGSKTYVAGMIDGSFSISGMFDATYIGYVNGLLGGLQNLFEYGPSGNTSTRVKYSGSCLITSVQVGASIGDMVSMSFDAQITGAVTVGTFP